MHYATDFYAPFERLYQKAPRTENFYRMIVQKVSELGRFASYAFYSFKPGTVLLWVAIVVVAMLGGSML
ncbi:MAG: hypothetical protein IH607_03495 [Firmicutes bacterium]|nr:hypothetical protein [Bacillota bacterium]